MMAANGNLFGQTFGDGMTDGEHFAVVLPLNLIAHIISYLDEARDLARISETCRVLYYMTLPQLYQNVTLRSHGDIRYVDGSPEGSGGASPFATALNGLVTRNIAGLVRSLKLCGQFRDYDSKGHSLVGRLPDSAMLLNIVVRAAIDRMEKLQSFSWELDTAILDTVYQGLASRPNLLSLTLKFHSSRTSRATTLIPPMSTLRRLQVTDIDPLCYQDDISLLLLKSENLEDLRLHWSERMRAEREPSVSLNAYFGKCIAAKRVLRIKSLGFQNLFCLPAEGFEQIMNVNNLERLTMLNVLGGSGGDEVAFYDSKWRKHIGPSLVQRLKFLRIDSLNKVQVEMLRGMTGLEELYLVNENHMKVSGMSTKSTPSSMISSNGGYSNASSPSSDRLPNFGTEFLDIITQNHGSTLRHLLLSEKWRLGHSQLGIVVRSCPNLEQFGFALERSIYDVLSILLPFLPKLRAFRLLDDANVPSYEDLRDTTYGDTRYACSASQIAPRKLRYIGLGDRIYEFAQKPRDPHAPAQDGKEFEEPDFRRVSKEAVEDYLIWTMDSPNL